MRLLALCWLLAPVILSGCGGGGSTYGAGNGSGNVLRGGTIVGSLSGVGSLGVLPIANATVTAVRQDLPAYTYRTLTDANGDYILSNVGPGRYRLGFQAYGFFPIPPQSNAAVQMFSEPGVLARAPTVVLQASTTDVPVTGVGSTGALPPNVNLVVTLLDSTTGNAVTGALITAGAATAREQSAGVYILTVPAQEASLQPYHVALSAQAGGYDSGTVTPQEVTILPGQVTQVTARVGPFISGMNGRIQLAGGAPLSSLSTVSIMVTGLSSTFTQPTIDLATGHFRLTLPASTSTNRRSFTISFVSPDFNLVVLNNIVAPQAGTLTLNQTVVLTPIGTEVSGTVLTSDSGIPGPGSTVTIVQLGRQTNIIGGTYNFSGVPTGKPLTLSVTAFNGAGRLESAQLGITPALGGGTFNVPAIMTH